jgi:hypothetical protein
MSNFPFALNPNLLTLLQTNPMKRYTSRPSPTMSAIGLVVGVFMLIFGIVFLANIASHENKLPGPVIAFMIVWFVVLIGIMAYHASNAFGKKGMPTTIIEAEDTTDSQSPSDRLRQLEDLRQKNLITETEYQSKRQEIVSKL